MNKPFLVIVAVAAMMLSGCAGSVRIFHDQDPTADFTNYSSYNFLPWTEGNQKSVNEIERERIQVAFAREIERRGLVFKPDGADLSIQITVLHRERNDVYPSYRYGYYRPYYGSPGVYNSLERALTLDIYDNSARKHIWHSAAVGELEYDAQKRDEQMPVVVGKMLADFPLGSI